jgi:hypothetical protein
MCALQRQAVTASAPSNKPDPVAAARGGSTSSSNSVPVGKDTALPEGFFADKAADAKARGVRLPDAKDKEDEFQVCVCTSWGVQVLKRSAQEYEEASAQD